MFCFYFFISLISLINADISNLNFTTNISNINAQNNDSTSNKLEEKTSIVNEGVNLHAENASESVNEIQNKNYTKIVNENQDIKNTDDIPTFGEYREKLEKESKQKRESTNMKAYREMKDHSSHHETDPKINPDEKGVHTDSNKKDKTTVPDYSEKGGEHTHIANENRDNQVKTDAISPENLANPESSPENREKSLDNTTDNKPITNQDSNGKIKAEDLPTNQNSKLTSNENLDSGKPTNNKTGDHDKHVVAQVYHKQNMAAKECGAKILEQSSEIIQANFVLTNNNDEYMNMPCSANQKWLILETCEPVLIRSIQLANYEMFSSKFKTFKVFASDRYPVKHWHEVGTFEALDQKELQSFQVTDTNMVKYIKFEFLDHYGSEHYCPLTFLRIYGNVVIDDEDDEMQHTYSDVSPVTQTHQNNEAHLDTEKKNENNPGGNILTKAKNIIKNMVTGISSKTANENSLEDNNDNSMNHETDFTKDLLSSTSPCLFVNFSSTFPDPAHLYYTFHSLLTSPFYLSNTLQQIPMPSIIRYNLSSILSHPDSSLSSSWHNVLHLLASYHNLTLTCKQLVFPLINMPTRRPCDICHKSMPYPHQSDDEHKDDDSHSFNDDKSESSITMSHVNSIINSLPEYNGADSQNDNNSTIMRDLDLENTTNHSAGEELVNTTTKNHYNGTNDQQLYARNGAGEKNGDDNSTNSNEDPGQSNLNSGSSSGQHNNQGVSNRQSLPPGSNAWNLAFMRIKNLARQLEHNVTVSMGYLETLSQNYKVQTEKLRRLLVIASDNITQIRKEVLEIRSQFHQEVRVLKRQLHQLKSIHYFHQSTTTTSTTTNLSQSPTINFHQPPSNCISLSIYAIVSMVVGIIVVNACVVLVMYHRLLCTISAPLHELSKTDLDVSSYPLVLPPPTPKSSSRHHYHDNHLHSPPTSLNEDKFYVIHSAYNPGLPSSFSCQDDCANNNDEFHSDSPNIIRNIGSISRSNIKKKDKKLKKLKNRIKKNV